MSSVDFRPFAPSVLAERADEWFEVGAHATSF
jgi:predicted NodU family carbamoyl transferase